MASRGRPALALGLVACALAAGTAVAQPEGASRPNGRELLGKRIDRIQFHGNRKVEDDAIVINMVSKVGGRLELPRVREDIRAMWKMGFFSDITVEVEPSEKGGVILTYSVKEK